MLEMSPMIARNWRKLKRPRGVSIVEEQERYGKYVAEPLERGYGYTVGEALKKILLSAIRGASVVACKANRISSEGQIAGIAESFESLQLNLKQLDLWMASEESVVVKCEVSKGAVYAKDLVLPEDVTVLNPDQYICTVTGASQAITLEIRCGYGYALASDHIGISSGLYTIDSIFSPVTRVNYSVSDARVGQRTDYNKLTLHVWTNGALTPQEAISLSAQIFREQMTSFINFKEEDEVILPSEEKEQAASYNPDFDLQVSELELPVRANNCLSSAEIRYIGELVQRTEQEMVKIKNFGRKSLSDIVDILGQRNLHLGMQIGEWGPPTNREGR
jgi:DNA-directed RNA polymerase subunit alpha